MTESTLTSPAMLKREALRLACLPVDGDWPEAATPGELAAWQYPCDYTLPKESRRRPRRQQRDFFQLAKNDIDAGKLLTISVIRNVSAMTEAIEYRATMFNGLPVFSRWGREVHPVKVPKRTTRPAEVQAIDRRACAAWLHAIGEKTRANMSVPGWGRSGMREPPKSALAMWHYRRKQAPTHALANG